MADKQEFECARKEGAGGEGGEDHPRPLLHPSRTLTSTKRMTRSRSFSEMPGVERRDLNVALENDVLRVEGQIDFTKYKEMEPVYTEYNIGHYATLFHALEQGRSGQDQR